MKKAKAKTATELDEREWVFSAVDESEIVACCYWEYARESNAIRDAVKIAKTAFANLGKAAPETAERQAFREATNRAYGLLHQTGYELQFWVGLSFSETPWQRIDENERKKWAHICPKIPVPVKFPPFHVIGDLMVASMLHSEAMKTHEARLALYRRLSQIDSGVANLVEATELRNKLDEQEKHRTPPVLQGAGGVDSFIAQINWHKFSKKEIKECFGKWVDAYFCPVAKPSGRGRPVDWRARLERLGLLRLRHAQTVDQAIQIIAKTLPVNQRTSEKFNTPGEFNREANSAVEDFHALFPFLDSAEMPLCWPMK